MPRASAHLVQTGFGPLADGLFHMFLGPDAVMLAAAAGAFSAMRARVTPRSGGVLFLYSWLAFYAVALWIQYPFDFPIPVALTLALMGLLVASDAPLPPTAVYLTLAWAGSMYGIIGGGSAVSMEHTLVALMLVVDLVVLGLVFLSAQKLTTRFPGARVAVRVGGSWITAIGMLQLGWAIKMRGQ